MIPARFEPQLFAALLSGLMSFIVSGIATLRAVGPVPHFFNLWLGAWLSAWLVAFPTALLVVPAVRRVVKKMVG